MTRYACIPLATAALMAVLPAWAVPEEPKEKPAPAAGAAKIDEPGSPSAKVIRTDREWQKLLTHDQYMVLRRRATEPPFTGRYATGHHRGVFTCAGCGAELFSSNHKFNSGTGWPSFFRPIRETALERAPDYDGAEPRIEVTCARCGGHLGHVFGDGPRPTGLRYCINSVALKLKPFPNATAKTAAKKPGRTKTAAPAKPDAKAAPASR
jgi:peptide-methionine (R)-S-oxide reductase